MDSFNTFDKKGKHQVKQSHNLLNWHNKNKASTSIPNTPMYSKINTKEKLAKK